MSLIDDLLAVRQREHGGSIATERFDFQACWGVWKILSLHRNEPTYAVAFEFHDDIVVIDDPVSPTKATFFQVKTDKAKGWTLARISRRPIVKGKKGASIAAKMYDNRLRFKDGVQRLVLISNQPANFDPGPFSTAPKNDFPKFLGSLSDEQSAFVASDGALFYFEQTPFSLSSYEQTIIGEIVQYLGEAFALYECNSRALYLALADQCRRRSRDLSEVRSFSDLAKAKFVTKDDVASWLNDFVSRTKSRPKWEEVVTDLIGMHQNSRAQIRREWHRYEQQKMAVLDLPTYELREAVRTWIASQSANFHDTVSLVDSGVQALAASKQAATLGATDAYLSAIILYERYSQ